MAPTDPPADLASIKLPFSRTPWRLIRLNLKRYADPLHWSKRGDYRFDSPTAKYGVLYTSTSVETAILEVFGDRWLLEREIDRSSLDDYDVCEIAIDKSIRVSNVTGRHINRLGIDSNFFATTDYETTQEWARALMSHPQEPGGIRYNSRKNPYRTNFALFGRADTKASVRVEKRCPLVAYPRLYRFLFSYDVAII